MTGIVIVLLIMQAICAFAIYTQADRIEKEEYMRRSAEKSLWGAVNRIGDECDRLRARIAKLEQKEGEQEC